MNRPMQCQREAARYASRPTHVDELRRATVKAAMRLIVLGDRAAALQVMYDGLALQCPLSFKPPTVVAA